MNNEHFEKLIKKAMAEKPSWFGDLEPPATVKEIAAAEQSIGVKLPHEYKYFANNIGAGYFGKINISSLKIGSEWFRADAILQLSDDQKFYVLTDDQTGGFYGFIVGTERCGDEILYVHPDDGGELEIVAQSLFEFVIENGLPHA